MKSLRVKLLALLIAIVGAAWLVAALTTYVDAHHEIDEMFDAQLAQSAKVLLSLAAHELKDAQEDGETIAEEIASGAHKYEQSIAFQFWSRDGHLLLRSASAPARALSGQRDGYADVTLEDHRWRVYSQWDEKREIQVQVGERHEFRAEMAEYLARRLLMPMAVFLPVLALLIWFGIGRGLAPLRRIGAEVAARDPRNLRPLDDRAVPTEVVALVASLNGLLGRLDEALEKERRFTADAAHELRTPLSALKTHAQVALRAVDDEQRRNALENLIRGVDRATHQVEQLLTLARLDPDAEALPQAESCDLAALARQALADLTPAAMAKNIELELSGAETLILNGNAGMIGILARNLVDNAIRYTPEGGWVKVSLAADRGAARLEVLDSGPGIPESERQRVWDRFYRVLGTQATGSGLGLSIVKRIADLHGARVSLEEGENGRGLRVRVDFPATKE
jgi:two-component system sensor histidine kinase QseC